MPEVEIERCTLTVHQVGWSAGPAPAELLERVLPGLEQAITAALAQAGLEDASSGVVLGAVELRLGPDSTPEPDGLAALSRALRDRLLPDPGSVHAAGSSGPPGSPGPAESLGSSGSSDLVPDPTSSLASDRVTAQLLSGHSIEGVRGIAVIVARMLARWSRSGRLPVMAGAWPPSVAAAWLTVLESAAGPAPPEAVITAQAIAQIADAVLSPLREAAAPVRELVLLGAVLASAGDRPLDLATLTDVRRAAGRGARGAPAGGEPGGGRPDPARAKAFSGERTGDVTPADGVTRRDSPGPAPQAQGAGHLGAEPAVVRAPVVVPALPFVVLIQLHRIGYLDGLVAAAATLDPPEEGLDGAAALAAALGALCLPPPGPRGERTPGETAAVLAVLAGRPAHRLDAVTDRLHHEPDLLGPLSSALTGCYADGPAPGEPLVLSEEAGGWLLGERAGALPIAWTGKRAALDPVLRHLGQPETEAGDTFSAFAAEFTERRAFPLLPPNDLERHLAAAAGTGLGALATGLWPELTGDLPLQALARLGDLEAQAETSADGLTVRLPRGRRWLDLQRAGLLGAWPVPWAPGARWELGTW